MRSYNHTTITWNLVTIPVRLYASIDASGRQAHYYHAACSGRLTQRYRCDVCDQLVESADQIRGYDSPVGPITFSPEEWERIKGPKPEAIEILAGVDHVDRGLIQRTTYLGPDKGGARAYSLLTRVLAETKTVAIGRSAEHLVAVRVAADAQGLVLEHLVRPERVRPFSAVEAELVPVTEAEVDAAKRVLKLLPREFPTTVDEVAERLEAAIAAKSAGRTVPRPKAAEGRQAVDDLLSALKASLEAAAPKPARRKRGAKT